MNTLKVFTAFSGYDSQCMALDRLNIDYYLVGWSEIDKYAIQAHNAVYPQYADRNYGDISKIDWMKVPDFDLFTYSFPCTDISSAGQQKGLTEGSGTRSSLLWECRKTIEIKRPKYLLMENVKALTSDKFMPYLRKWLSFLESMGYSNFTKVLNSKDYGVPQNRERVFVVSILGDERYYFPKPFKLEKRLKDVLESNVDDSYYLSKKMTENITFSHKETKVGITYEGDVNKGGQKGAILSKEGICSALTATDYKQPKQILQPEFKYGNKRVQNLVDSGKISGDKVEYIDAYNQSVSDLCGTIRTTIDTSCMMFVTEPKSCAMRGRNPENPSDRNPGIPTEQRIEMGGDVANCLTTVQKDSLIAEPSLRIKQATKLGYIDIKPGSIFDASYPDSNTRRGRVQGDGKISPTLTAQGDPPCYYEGVTNKITTVQKDNLLVEPKITEKIDEPLDEDRKRLNDLHVEVDGNVIGISVNPNSRKLEFNGYKSIKDVSPTLRATDYKCPHTVWLSDKQIEYKGKKLKEGDGLYLGTSKDFFRGGLENVSRTLKAGIYDAGVVQSYRIRKLTPRECFRLMGVSEQNIDKMMSAGISKTQLYKMAGNSIVVDVLYYIFKKMFIDKKANKGEQQILFG